MAQQSNIAATQPSAVSHHAAASRGSAVIAYKSEGNGHIQIRENRSDYHECPEQTFSRLPQKEPVDMQFENISYTASLGFRKGKALFISVHQSEFHTAYRISKPVRVLYNVITANELLRLSCMTF
jgi:hypothetical protein